MSANAASLKSPVSIMLNALQRDRKVLNDQKSTLPKRLEAARHLMADVSYIAIQHRKNPSYATYCEVKTSLQAISSFVGNCDTAIKVHDARTKNIKREMAHDGFTKHERKKAVQDHEKHRPNIKLRELRRLIFGLAYYEDRFKSMRPIH